MRHIDDSPIVSLNMKIIAINVGIILGIGLIQLWGYVQ